MPEIVWFFAIILILDYYGEAILPKQIVNRPLAHFEASWSTQGIKTCGLTYADFIWPTGSIPGLKCIKSRGKGTKLIEVPIDQCLSVPNQGNDGDIPPQMKELFQELKGLNRLSLKLCLEHEDGQDSKYWPYIDSLPGPRELDTPFYWEDLDTFPYRHMVGEVRAQQRRWQELHDRITAIRPSITTERFYWAMEMVRSRAFRGVGGGEAAGRAPLFASVSVALLGAAVYYSGHSASQDLALGLATLAAVVPLPLVLRSSQEVSVLLPVIDSCNHRSQTPTATLDLEPLEGSFVVTAETAVAAGEEVTISYGDRTNDELLQFYGFCEVDNQHDEYALEDMIIRRGENFGEWSIPASMNADSVRRAIMEERKRLETWLVTLDDASDHSPSCSTSELRRLFISEKVKLLTEAEDAVSVDC